MERRSNLLARNASTLKADVQSLSRIRKNTTTDEKKNLSKHHLILPNNTQICVETLLSQCISEEQNDRRIDTKLRTCLRKKRLALFKPKNFILKNEKLRPIVTTNIKSGVFRSICSVEFTSQKKGNFVTIVPSNVLYSQSTLPSRIQSVDDFCNDKWIVERTTQYMPNDWTRPLRLSGVKRHNNGSLNDAIEKTKSKDWLNRTIRSRPTDNENYEQKKSTIHRLVTPEGFQLCVSNKSTIRSDRSHLGTNDEFKQPLQQHERTIHQPKDRVENVEVIPVPRTRFSRATRSPLKNNNVQFSTLPVVYCPEKIFPEGTVDNRFAEKVTGTKNGLGDKNRCRTCHKQFLHVIRTPVDLKETESDSDLIKSLH